MNDLNDAKIFAKFLVHIPKKLNDDCANVGFCEPNEASTRKRQLTMQSELDVNRSLHESERSDNRWHRGSFRRLLLPALRNQARERWRCIAWKRRPTAITVQHHDSTLWCVLEGNLQ